MNPHKSTMTSRERMLAAINGDAVDYIPCSFMIFANLSRTCKSVVEFVQQQVALGLDAFVHVGYLPHALHPEAKYHQWIERNDKQNYFCRRIDTPKGPLTTRVKQWNGWPTEDDFPLFSDWVVPRTEEILVKPEQDLEKVVYLFGEFRDEDILGLRDTTRAAKNIADKHDLVLVGGWTAVKPNMSTDDGVMGADALAWLSGYQDVMVLSETKPDIVKEYVRIIHEWNMKQISIYLDVAKPDLIVRRGWYETTEFWTPRGFRKIIAPVLRREVELVHQAGKKFGYIITSAFHPILDDILDCDIDVLIGLDPKEGKGTGLSAVKDAFLSRRKAVWGGVSGAITVELGTESETEQAVIDALSTLGRGSGFILSPVDNVREDTENTWRNTNTFIHTWKRHRSQHTMYEIKQERSTARQGK